MIRLLIALFSLSLAYGETILKTAAQVANFQGEDTPMVDLEATVTYVDAEGTIFLADGTGATFLSRYRGDSPISQGMRLSIKGTRHPGLYIGGIIPSKVEIIGRTTLPPPRSVNYDEVRSGKFHYQRVGVEGIARSFERTGETSANLYLAMAKGILRIQLGNNNLNAKDLIGAEIRVSGLAAGGIDDRRRLVDPFLKTISDYPIEILQQAPEKIPTGDLTSITKGWESPAKLVQIRATALSPNLNGSVFVSDGEEAIRIQVPSKFRCDVGDVLTIVGFPTEGQIRPYIEAKRISKSGAKKAVDVENMKDDSFDQSNPDAHLVRLVGTLRSQNPPVLSSHDHEIEIRIPEGLPLNAEVGSQLSLTGIWQITGMSTGGFRRQPASFAIQLRNAGDINVLSAPSWWNITRLSYILGICILIGALAAFWAFALRRQVAKQVQLIAEKTQNEAVTEERQRIALEFHDSLEQELAGLSIRLDAVRTRLQNDTKEASLIAQLGKILSRLQTETRDFINDLRTTTQPPFAESLHSLITHLAETTETPIQLAPIYAPEPLSLEKHHLLRMAKEAIYNSLKHSKAKKLDVSFLGRVLTIKDDGVGFNPQNIPTGHFGLRGMRERCKKIGAQLEINSNDKSGTIIQVTLAPLSAEHS